MPERELRVGDSKWRVRVESGKLQVLNGSGSPVLSTEDASVYPIGENQWSVLLDGRSFLVRQDGDAVYVNGRKLAAVEVI
ncbi:MAG TPA: hypothetical protein VE621_17485, partial [Bryobacteraceae bacterium]|nr:hypothetical protein [Bryobacteraceae bacterium]